jgi:hypothetical protein
MIFCRPIRLTVILRVQLSTEMKPSPIALENDCGVYVSSVPPEDTSSQNSTLLNNLRRRLCEPPFTCMNAKAYDAYRTDNLSPIKRL